MLDRVGYVAPCFFGAGLGRKLGCTMDRFSRKLVARNRRAGFFHGRPNQLPVPAPSTARTVEICSQPNHRHSAGHWAFFMAGRRTWLELAGTTARDAARRCRDRRDLFFRAGYSTQAASLHLVLCRYGPTASVWYTSYSPCARWLGHDHVGQALFEQHGLNRRHGTFQSGLQLSSAADHDGRSTQQHLLSMALWETFRPQLHGCSAPVPRAPYCGRFTPHERRYLRPPCCSGSSLHCRA